MTEIMWEIGQIGNFQDKVFLSLYLTYSKALGSALRSCWLNSPSELAVFRRWDGLGCGRSWIAVTPRTNALLLVAGSFSYRLLLQGESNVSENAQNFSRSPEFIISFKICCLLNGQRTWKEWSALNTCNEKAK